MEMQNCMEATREYYARWLGVEADALGKPGIQWIYNPQRNRTPRGYAGPFDVYTMIGEGSVLVSYGDRALPHIPKIKERLSAGMTAGEIGPIFGGIGMSRPEHHVKYVYTGKTAERQESGARRLTAEDGALYLDFYKKAHPDCRDLSWVEAYFTDIAGRGCCHGVVADGRLVSATDAPDMPFMSGQVQEIGIHTLPSYRNRGYAKTACLSCIGEMRRRGVCPLWSTAADNAASQKLAESIGFTKLFDNISLRLGPLFGAAGPGPPIKNRRGRLPSETAPASQNPFACPDFYIFQVRYYYVSPRIGYTVKQRPGKKYKITAEKKKRTDSRMYKNGIQAYN